MMDIWQWYNKLEDELIEAGQVESVNTLQKFTSYVCDLETEKTEAIYPEVQALCKTINNPWLDVFTRHWWMRHRIGNCFEGETCLKDVVALFEYAHRDETMDCPQSVCVTQDICDCYSHIDGPGWAKERINICDETLARITPHWSCYQCITSEKISALLDQNKVDEAYQCLSEHKVKLYEATGEASDIMLEEWVDVYLAQGNAQAAIELIEEVEAKINEPEWKTIKQKRELRKLLTLVHLQRDDEAWKLVEALKEDKPANHVIWIKALALLISRHQEENTWLGGRYLYSLLIILSESGNHRDVIASGILCAQLALQRQAVWSARRILTLILSHQSKLNIDLGASEQLHILEQHINQEEEKIELPVAAESLITWLNQQDENTPRDPEHEAQWLLLANKQLPENKEILTLISYALLACNAHELASTLLWDALRNDGQKNKHDLAYQLIDIYLHKNDLTGIQELADFCQEIYPEIATWCLAKKAEFEQDWLEVERHCCTILAQYPDKAGAKLLLAASLLRQQKYAQAADYYLELSQLAEDPKELLWEHIVAASANQDWEAVRKAAVKLDMTLTNHHGVVEESCGLVIIRYYENDRYYDYYATRTGPVTARILENAHPSATQHLRDWLVFYPSLVIPYPEDEEEQENFIPTFSCFHTLSSGNYGESWPLDGAHPGAEAIEAFEAAIEKLGWGVSVLSPTDYTVFNSESDAELPGIYLTVAAPTTVSLASINDELALLTKDWPHAMCWLSLAQTANIDVEYHRRVIEQYQL